MEEFIRGWINPAIQGNATLENLLTELGEIDQAGIYHPVLCQELHLLGGRMVGGASREELRSEVQHFVEFLKTL